MVMATDNQSTGPSIFSDLQSLNGIRNQAKVDSRAAIKAAAKEFEAFFMNMMLKSMRQASEVIGEDSMFNSQQEKMFIGMLDEQMSVELSQKGNLGIADLMARNILGDDYNLPHETKSLYSKMQQSPTMELEPSRKSTSIDIDSRNISDVSEKKVEGRSKESLTAPETVLVPAKQNIDKNRTVEKNKPVVIQAAIKEVDGVAEKKSLFDSASSFVTQLLPSAQKIAQKLGVDPKLLLAQAALETGWGKYIMHDKNGLPSHNLFGIKSSQSWQGNSVKVDTLEVEKGAFVKKNEKFRMYDSFEKSFDDYAKLLQNSPRYQAALEVAKDAEKFVESLQSAGYATDPDYAKKILRIFNFDINVDIKAD